jgi:hypothetical protein
MVQWIIANAADLIAILTAIVTVASLIAKVTPTEVDNKGVAFALKIIDALALNTKPTELKPTELPK